MKKSVRWDDPSAISLAACVLRMGGVLLSSTDTVFGIASMANADGARALDAVKKRNHDDKPYLLLVGSVQEAVAFMGQSSLDVARILMEACWPGPLTIVIKAADNIPYELVSSQGTIAIRLPAHAGLQRLLGVTGPLFSTSANVSGEPVPQTHDLISPVIWDAVQLAIFDEEHDQGMHEAVSSTIVDCSGKHVVLVRQGAYPLKEIQEALGSEKLLFEHK